MDNKKEIKKDKVFDKSLLNKKKILKLCLIVLIFIYSLIVHLTTEGIDLVLGDFGSIIPLLLYFFSYMSFKWLPILCIVGLIFTLFEEKFKDMSKNFIYIISIMVVVGTVVKLLV